MKPARIFVCYRRRDAGGHAHSVAQALRQKFGNKDLYMDTFSIDPGEEWPARLRQAIENAEVVVVVIGPAWGTIEEPGTGQRCLARPNDWVRQEVSLALKTNKLVIPVLVDSAQLPSPDLLPADIAPILERHAIEVRLDHFDHDIERLITCIRTHRQPDLRGTLKRVANANLQGLAVVIQVLVWPVVRRLAIPILCGLVFGALGMWALNLKTGEVSWNLVLIGGALGIAGAAVRWLSTRVTIGGALSGSFGSTFLGLLVGAASWLVLWMNGYVIDFTNKHTIVFATNAINSIIKWLASHRFVSAGPIEAPQLHGVLVYAIGWGLALGIAGVLLGLIGAFIDGDFGILFAVPTASIIVGAVVGAIGYGIGWWAGGVVALGAGTLGWILALTLELYIYQNKFDIDDYFDELTARQKIRLFVEGAIGGPLFGVLGWLLGKDAVGIAIGQRVDTTAVATIFGILAGLLGFGLGATWRRFEKGAGGG